MLLLMCIVACTSVALAQNRTVRGTVLEEGTNEPIIGASVQVKGTVQGVVTDFDGNFVIQNVPASAKTLRVSYVGMRTTEVAIRANVRVFMESETSQLDELIVVAYGTAKKSSFAGSASLVKSEALKDLPNTSFESALNGKVAGLQITQSSGQAGSAPSIRIRGIGSMNASNEPLYVVDGVPMTSGDMGQLSDYTYSTNNAMNSINPDDIESISVLKDAAASSLYGSRAANGVVLITTKKGAEGRPTVSLKASWAFTPSWATDNYETASVQENVNMLYTVFYDYRESRGAETANTYALSQLNKKFNKHGYEFSTAGTDKYENVIISSYDNSGRGGQYFDWDKAYFRTALYQTYDMSVSGGNSNTTYYSSLSYTKDEGRLKVNNFDRVSGRVNLSQKVGRFLQFDTNVNYARTSKSGYNDTRNTNSNYFLQTRNLLWGLYWPTDYSTGEDWTARYGSYAQNNLYYQNLWENSSITNHIQASETLTLHLLQGLDLKSVFSYDHSGVRDHIYYSAEHYSGSSTNGTVTEMNTNYEKMVSSTTLNYNKVIADKHGLGLMVGFEAEKNKTDYLRATGEGLPTSTLHTVSTAGTLTSAGYNWGNSMVSILSKADYNFRETYYASASYRRDGSSRLSQDNRWGNFWSVAGAWKITNEKFMEPAKDWLSDLRVRVSYGVNGTLPTSNYGYMNLMSYTSNYLGNPGGTITTLANSDLSWETSYSTNVGLDFGFLHNRIHGTVEYFNRTSKNLLQDVPVSTVTGHSSTLQNVGEINNHGFEVEIGGDIIDTKDLRWSASVNAAFIKNQVSKLYGGADIIWYDPTGGDSRAQFMYREGEPVLSFYGLEWAGVDPENGKSVYYVNGATSSEGDFQFNGRGATYDYEKANETIIGNATPTVSGGINTNVSWKGIDFGLNFIYKLGGELYDGAYKDVADDGYYWERIRAKNYYDNMWTPTNTSGTQPALSGSDLTDAMQYSSRHISSASFLRLKTLSLGYSLPRNLIKKVFLSSARIYFNATNLWTIAKYKDADPEVNQYGTRGWETPLGKTFTFGVDLKF